MAITKHNRVQKQADGTFVRTDRSAPSEQGEAAVATREVAAATSAEPQRTSIVTHEASPASSSAAPQGVVKPPAVPSAAERGERKPEIAKSGE